MAIVSYSVNNQVPEFDTWYSADLQRFSDETNPALLALADGGFAVAFAWHDLALPGNYSVLLDLYNADGTVRSTNTVVVDTFIAGTLVNEPALTQLTDGNILVTFTDANDPGIHFAVVDPADGTILTADTKLSGTDASDIDSRVVPLASGAWAIVKQNNASGTDQDADIVFYDNTGTFVTFVALGGNSPSDERQPVVAVLNNGNLAAAFEKEISDGSGTYGLSVQIFDPTGGGVLGQFAFDTSGTQNLNPAILALNDGGFAVAYEDNEYGVSGEAGLTIAFFDQSGALAGKARVDDGANQDSTPSLSLLANGYVAVSYTDHFGVGDTDIMLAVFDPVSRTRVIDPTRIEGQSGLQSDPSVATLIDGTVVTAWSDFNSAIEDGNTDPDDAHVSLRMDRIVRTWVLSNAGEGVTGDALDDSMVGGDGNDTLVGGSGIDTLRGGAGMDDMFVGAGGVADGEIFDGGGDFDYITVFGTGSTILDFRGSTVTSVEQLYFANVNGGGAAVRFTAAQFAFESVEYEAQITGVRTVAIDMDSETALDLSGLSISPVAAGDHFEINGDGDGESITGTSIADRIEGNLGNDTLDGGSGVDTLNGGAGDDTFRVSVAGDTSGETYDGGADIDTMEFYGASGTVNLRDDFFDEVDHLSFVQGAGETITAVLDVSQLSGPGWYVSVVKGGAGTDIVELHVAPGGSLDLTGMILETFGDGNGADRFTLVGDTGAESITGSAVNDSIEGGAGNDTLRGGFGDTLDGGSGNDTYYDLLADDPDDNDIFIESAGGGQHDLIISDFGGFSLLGFGEIEDLTGIAATNVLGGNTKNNILTGAAGADTLNGLAGNDSMIGGTGNDTYFVDSKNDVLNETTSGAAGGADTVNSAASTFTLGANVEDLILDGAKNSEGVGNELANRITGNTGRNALKGLDGADTLTGGDGDDELRGGTGADRMNGGLGNDRFFVDISGDQTIESNANAATGGIDTVFTTVSRTLSANIENLRLQGSDPLNGNGNELNNKIFGNTGANLLKGLAGNDTIEGRDGADTIEGGEGNDTLSGGGQGDVFRFAASNTGVDRILDFSKNGDRFDLNGGTFTALSTAANGDAVLTHAGGAIRIASPPNLTLAQWNALVLPSGGRVASDDALAATGSDPSGAGLHAGGGHSLLLSADAIAILHHGEWLYA